MAHMLVDLLHQTVSSQWVRLSVKHLWIPKVCRCLVNICQINGWMDGWWALGKWCWAGHKNKRKMGNIDMKLKSRDRDEQPRLDWMSWSQWGHGFSVWGSRGVPRVRPRKVRSKSGVTWSLRGSGYMLVVLVQAQTQFCHLRGCSCHYLSAPPLALKGIEWTSILSGSSFLFQTSNKPVFTVYASMKWNRDSQRFLFGMFLANRFVSVCVWQW